MASRGGVGKQTCLLPALVIWALMNHEEVTLGGKGPWVLITDDSPTVCQMLKSVLAEIGLEGHELVNFLDLPRILRHNPPAMVVLDLERPGGLSGPAIGRFIRQYESSPIPIIVFSSLPESVRSGVCRDIDAQGTVGKESDLRELIHLVKSLLQEQPARPN